MAKGTWVRFSIYLNYLLKLSLCFFISILLQSCQTNMSSITYTPHLNDNTSKPAFTIYIWIFRRGKTVIEGRIECNFHVQMFGCSLFCTPPL